MTSPRKFANARSYNVTPSLSVLILNNFGLLLIIIYLVLFSSVFWAILFIFLINNYEKYRQLLQRNDNNQFEITFRFINGNLIVIQGEHTMSHPLTDIKVLINRWFVYLDTGSQGYLLMHDSFQNRSSYSALRREFHE